MCGNSPGHQWPLAGTALVVDDEPVAARTCAAQLKAVGCPCHLAGSYSEALAIMADQPDIGLVIADHGVDGDDMEEFVTTLRASRPGVIVVGSSGSGCRAELKRFGVERFLSKPWRVEDLIDLLSGRIEKCAMCSIPLPLRHPFEGEVGQHWECAFCGCLFQAVLDQDALGDTFRNVRRSE